MSHLEEWREYLRAWLPGAMPATPMDSADEILHYLGRWDGERLEIQKALLRPKCRWPLRYEEGVKMESPMLMVCVNVIKNDRPRLLALAARGNAAACSETLLTDFRLARASDANAPLLIGLLVNITSDLLVLQSLQHILPVIRFNEERLGELQQQLELISVAPVSQSMSHERVAGSDWMLHLTLEDLRRVHYRNILPFESTPYEAQQMASNLLLVAMANRPEGWKLLDAATYASFIHDEVRPCVDEVAGTILRTRVTAMEKVREMRTNSAGWLSLTQDLPNYFGELLSKAAKQQAMAREALLWCAIERYCLKHERIPDKLDELVPEFIDKLPCDPVNGLPLRYARKGERDYLLYSIGWNEKDDGGVETRNRDLGDWVWASNPKLIRNLDEERRLAELKAEEGREKRRPAKKKAGLSAKSKMRVTAPAR
jgi:hypothetical protein